MKIADLREELVQALTIALNECEKAQKEFHPDLEAVSFEAELTFRLGDQKILIKSRPVLDLTRPLLPQIERKAEIVNLEGRVRT